MNIGDDKIKFWCQKILPLVYDDSLSYYEVLDKVVVYINQNIEDINTIIDEIGNIEGDIEDVRAELEAVATEIRAKLDVIDGKIEDIEADIANIIDDSVVSTDTTFSSSKINDLFTNYFTKSEINGMINDKANAINLALVYDPNEQYDIGDYCIDGYGMLFKCISPTTGEFEENAWVMANLTEDIANIIASIEYPILYGTTSPTSTQGDNGYMYIEYNEFAVTALYAKVNNTWYELLSWNIVANGYIKIADNASSMGDIGYAGQNAYVFIDKTVEATGGLYFEWDVEIENNYRDILNFTNLGNRGGNYVNNYRVVLGGNIGNDSSHGSIYNFGSQGVNDTPLIAISRYWGNVISDSDSEKIEIPASGRYQFLLGDSAEQTNNKKFALFALYDWYHGNFSGVNYGYIKAYCPAYYTNFFKLYSLKIWQEASKVNLLHYYTPAIRNGHKGVYDNVSEVFYPCSNDDFFEVGYDLSESTYSFINDNQTVNNKTWSSKKINHEINDAVDTVVDITGHINLTGTLTAGSTSYVFTNSNISGDTMIIPFTDDYNVTPTSVIADDSNHTLTMTFEAQNSDIAVGIQIWKVV